MFEQAGIMIQYWKDLESSIMIWYWRVALVELNQNEPAICFAIRFLLDTPGKAESSLTVSSKMRGCVLVILTPIRWWSKICPSAFLRVDTD